MLGQTSEVLDASQSFAERFGWEALVIVAMMAFVGVMLWRIGGHLANVVANYILSSTAQVQQLGEVQSKISEAIGLLSVNLANQATTLNRIEANSETVEAKVDKIMFAIRSAAQVAIDTLPETATEARRKLQHVIEDLGP